MAITGLGPVVSFGQVAWLVPGAFIGIPGLLIVAVVAVQVAGGIAFVPIVRRVLGGIGPWRRREATGRPG